MSHDMDKMSGKAKEMTGKATDNKQMQAEGKLQQLKAKAADAIDDMKQKMDK